MNMNKVKLGLISISVAVLATGCTATQKYPTILEDGSQGYLTVSGDAAGWREYNRGVIGIVSEVKAPRGSKSTQYWETQKAQDKALTVQKVPKDTPGYGAALLKYLRGEDAVENSQEVLPVIPSTGVTQQ